MQRIDLLIVGVLVLAGVGSALGVLTYEDDRRATFRIQWTTTERSVDLPFETSGDASGEMEGTVDVEDLNVTRAVWTVRVTGAPARVQPVPIRIEAVAPDNTSASGEGALPAGAGASTEVSAEVMLAPMPVAETFTGATLDEARIRLAAATSTTNGTGLWTIRISIADPGPLGAAEQIAVAVTGSIERYEATLSPETPEVSRG